MIDRRLHPATENIAHVSLRGRVGDLPLTEGEDCEIAAPLADLCETPGGARARQVMQGQGFCVIERRGDHAFGFARRDGYCGWVAAQDLRAKGPKTHWVCQPLTHLYPAARVQAPPLHPLPMLAQVRVMGQEGGFAQTDSGYIPRPHLMPLGQVWGDPAEVAAMFLHCPYLWGGNSAMGLDCSGLVQAALLACGHSAPGDSDLQRALGRELPEAAASQRGDLLFWRGHVAMVLDGARLIHANGHSMSVAIEPIAACIQRIAEAGGGPLLQRRRLAPI
jgi:cell wall-associated NlpC family hydrolase